MNDAILQPTANLGLALFFGGAIIIILACSFLLIRLFFSRYLTTSDRKCCETRSMYISADLTQERLALTKPMRFTQSTAV